MRDLETFDLPDCQNGRQLGLWSPANDGPIGTVSFRLGGGSDGQPTVRAMLGIEAFAGGHAAAGGVAIRDHANEPIVLADRHATDTTHGARDFLYRRIGGLALQRKSRP